jgi:hypothetical protein
MAFVGRELVSHPNDVSDLVAEEIRHKSFVARIKCLLIDIDVAFFLVRKECSCIAI